MNCEPLELDPETFLEEAAASLSCVGGLAAVIVGVGIIRKGTSQVPVSIVAVSAAICLVFGWVRYLLDDRYVLDFESQSLLFRRKFGKGSRDKVVCRFDQLRAVAINPIRRSNKSNVWWEYGLSLYTARGKAIRVLSPARDGYGNCQIKGLEVSRRLDVPFHDGGKESVLVMKRSPRGIEFESRPHGIWDLMRPIVLSLGFLTVAAIVVFAVKTLSGV